MHRICSMADRKLSGLERFLFKTVAVLLAYLFFVVAPSIIKPHWESFVDAVGGEKNVYTYVLLSLHLSILFVGNAVFFVLCVSGIPFFDRFRITPGPWPWQVPSERAEYIQLVLKAVGLTLFNNFVLALPASFANYNLAKSLGLRSDVESFPSSFTLLWQILAFMLIEDGIFYCNHRLLHSVPFLYKHVHKLHHRFHFSVSIAAEFSHPIEFLLGNSMPFAAGPILLGAHSYTMLAWTVWRICETLDGHCGYDLPFAPYRLLPFAGSAGGHDAHHSINTGNYGSFFHHWDLIFKTNISEEAVQRFLDTRRKKADLLNAAASNESKND